MKIKLRPFSLFLVDKKNSIRFNVKFPLLIAIIFIIYNKIFNFLTFSIMKI